MEIYVWILICLHLLLSLIVDQPKGLILNLILYSPIFGRILGWW